MSKKDNKFSFDINDWSSSPKSNDLDFQELLDVLPSSDEDDNISVEHKKQPVLNDNNNDVDVSLETAMLVGDSTRQADILDLVDSLDPSDEDNEYLPMQSFKPETNDCVEDSEVDISDLFQSFYDNGMAKQHNAKTTTPPADEYATALHMMDKFHFAYCNHQLYVWTNPAYETFDDVEFIAMLKEKSPIELLAQKPSFWKNVLYHIKTTRDIHINLYEYEHPYYEVVFANGIYNVFTGQIREATPDDYILYFNRIEYNPNNAKRNSTSKQYIKSISGGNKEVENMIWTSIGAMLSPTTKFKKFFYAFGVPNSGKSIFGQVCENLIGSNNCSHIPLNRLHAKFSMAQMEGKALNLNMDTPSTVLKELGNLKLLTSGGPDTTEDPKKYGAFKKIRTGTITLLFGSNNPLKIAPNEDVKSIRERLAIIPFMFSVSPEDRDPMLFEKLMDEKDYLIKKALKAYKRLVENNFVFPECAVSQSLLDDWIPEPYDDILSEMIDHGIVVQDSSNCIMNSELYDAYLSMCKDMERAPLCYNTFIASVKQSSSVQSTRINQKHALRGLKIIA